MAKGADDVKASLSHEGVTGVEQISPHSFGGFLFWRLPSAVARQLTSSTHCEIYPFITPEVEAPLRGDGGHERCIACFELCL